MTTRTRLELERHELDAIEHRRLTRRAKGEADVLGRLRHDVRGLGQDGVGQMAGRIAPQPRFDCVRRTAGALRLEQQIDVEAVPAIGRDAPAEVWGC